MASLPRWIEDTTVDSAAMFGAFLAYLNKCIDPDEASILQILPMVLHAPYDGAGSSRWKPCDTYQCQRCAMGRGGYQFRWYDARWYDDYANHARPGAWLLNNKRQSSPIAPDTVPVSNAKTINDVGNTSAALWSRMEAGCNTNSKIHLALDDHDPIRQGIAMSRFGAVAKSLKYRPRME